MDWLGLKEVASHVGLSRDALHIYAALLIQIVAAAALRRPLSSYIPWLVVLAAELLNEYLDIRYGQEAKLEEWQLIAGRHDILNTMALPTLLLLLCRFAPGLFNRSPVSADEIAPQDGAEKTGNE